MRLRRLVVALVIANLVFLAIQLAHGRTGPADPAAAPVVRARSFELVDEQGRVRMEMKVIPAQPHFKMPDGTIGFPESVLLRMFSSQGAPNVKIVATEDGAEASFVGQEGNVVVKARTRAAPYVTTFAKDGREKVLKP